MFDLTSDPSIYNANNWEYLQEGNENLILIYKGLVHILQNYVLRLSKTLIGEEQEPNKEVFNLHSCFTNEIIIPFLGKQYLSDKFFIPVSEKFLSDLDQKILPLRPENRIHKRINTKQTFAILTQNIIRVPSYLFGKNSLDSFSVEIKPKWGFLPNSPFIKNEIKLKHCRFCMHQSLKSSESIDFKKSSYCPLELYSKNPTKMLNCIKNLFLNPQNNLRTFGNGKELNLTEATDFISRLFNINESDSLDFIARIVVDTLLEEGILDKLKELQQSLDIYDIEGVNQIMNSLDSSLGEPNEKDWKDLSKSVLNGEFKKVKTDVETLDYDDKRKIIYGFLASATFKDCSIMIAFTAHDSDLKNSSSSLLPIKELNSASLKSGRFEKAAIKIFYQLGAVDLDPKSIKKMAYYFDLDQKIVKNYQNILGN